MDRHLKERLVGAAVLVATAIILIPEMLSGPGDGARSASKAHDKAAVSEEGAVKTYTIDLARKPIADAPAPATASLPAAKSESNSIEVTPAPPEDTGSAPEQTAPVEKSTSVAPKPKSEKIVQEEKSAQENNVKAAAEKHVSSKSESSSIATPKKPEDSDHSATTAKTNAAGAAWAVQVASLGTRNNADRMATELKEKGHAAFVTAFQVKGQTMYRVRVGPVSDRAAAEAELRKVKTLYPGANLVPNS